jgi:hypothetical protein
MEDVMTIDDLAHTIPSPMDGFTLLNDIKDASIIDRISFGFTIVTSVITIGGLIITLPLIASAAVSLDQISKTKLPSQ